MRYSRHATLLVSSVRRQSSATHLCQPQGLVVSLIRLNLYLELFDIGTVEMKRDKVEFASPSTSVDPLFKVSIRRATSASDGTDLNPASDLVGPLFVQTHSVRDGHAGSTVCTGNVGYMSVKAGGYAGRTVGRTHAH